MSREDSSLSKVIRDFVEKSQKFYPGLRFSSSQSLYSGPEPTSCNFEYNFNNELLRGSPYEFSSATKLIHYIPSIEILFDIIKSGVFRLTSLNAKNDKHELSYLTKQLKIDISEDIIRKHKKQFYCASFSRVNSIHEEDFSMWRLYGSEGTGVALIFEVENNDDDWHHFTIGNVKYGPNDASEKYRTFIDFFENFQKENNRPIQNRPITSTAFLAFHKNTGWEYEEEVRLLSYYEYDEYSLEAKFESKYLLTDTFHNYKNGIGHYSYMELPLVGSSKYRKIENSYSSENMIYAKEIIDKMLPHLKLTKVILGYHYSIDNYIDISEIINCEVNKHPSLKPEVVMSKFSDHG